MGRRPSDNEVWPAVSEPHDGLVPGNKQSVIVGRVDLGERFDQIGCVTLIAAQANANGVSINCDTHRELICFWRRQIIARRFPELAGLGCHAREYEPPYHAIDAGSKASLGARAPSLPDQYGR